MSGYGDTPLDDGLPPGALQGDDDHLPRRAAPEDESATTATEVAFLQLKTRVNYLNQRDQEAIRRAEEAEADREELEELGDILESLERVIETRKEREHNGFPSAAEPSGSPA